MFVKVGGVTSNPKNVIANLRKLTHIYKLSRKRRNEESKNEGGGSKAVWTFFKKHPNWWRRSPLSSNGFEEILGSAQAA